MRLASLAIALGLAGTTACTSPSSKCPPPAEGGCHVTEQPAQHLPAPADPTFTLYVSNQSFDLDPVDIKLSLDNQLAITGEFVVEGQHTWIKFDFGLAPGNHTIRATSADSDAVLEQSFVMDDRKYGVVNFWFYAAGSPEPTPPQFSFTLSDTPPQFQ